MDMSGQQALAAGATELSPEHLARARAAPISGSPLPRAIAVIGAACMAALAFGLVIPPDYPFFGSDLYDLYARSLLHGRFDLPLRALRFEGHYTPDGVGYLYEGLGPLLTRLPFLPFVRLPTSWLSPLSIWFWSVLGNLCYHRAFSLALVRGRADAVAPPRIVHSLLAAAVWFASPGILLVANGTIYYEPVAMAYGLGGGFVLLIAMLSFGTIAMERAVLPLAVIAGLAVHARPHLAVGYYAGVCLIAAALARRGGSRERRKAALAMLVLGLFGGLLLASNALRFHSVAVMHGSFSKSEVQYGSVFWGIEDRNGWRARTFEQHGAFNAGRILPNAMVYLLTPQETALTTPAIDWLEGRDHALEAVIGRVRIEEPKVGLLFLWPAWMLLMIAGLRQRATWRMPGLAGTAAVTVGGLLMLSYATITLRYHVDLWPLIALPAVFGIAPAAAWMFDPDHRRGWAGAAMLLLVLIGFQVTATNIGRSRNLVTEAPGTLSSPWSKDHCLKIVARRHFSGAAAARLCTDPLADRNR
jgi:hypothetical protein